MARPGPAAAAAHLANTLSLDAPPRSAVELISQIAIEREWCDNVDASAELAEKWEKRFLRILRRDYTKLKALGRHCRYEFNSSSEYLIQGSVFVEASDPDDVTRAKRSRGRFDEYEMFLTALSPTQFEALSRGILALFKVRDPKLTRATSDEGIDFYGQLWLEDVVMKVSLPNVYRRMSMWMIGQAKKYEKTQAATPDIRELVGSIALARAEAFGSSSPDFDDLKVLLCDPVFYLFFTTGSISADVWRLLERSGVIGMDGPMIAAFLADNDVGVEGGDFKEELLLDWLAGHEG